VRYAAPVLTGQTAFGLTARLEYLDGYPVAFRHTPTLGRPRPDGLDRPDGLVAGNEGVPAGEFTGVMLMVVPHSPQAATRTNGSSSPTAGIARSRPTRWRGASKTNARAVAPRVIPAHYEAADRRVNHARRRVSRVRRQHHSPKRRLKLLAHHFQAWALLGSLSRLSQWLLKLQPFAHILRAGGGTVSPEPLLWLRAIDAALE
jgi:hypothetical protein